MKNVLFKSLLLSVSFISSLSLAVGTSGGNGTGGSGSGAPVYGKSLPSNGADEPITSNKPAGNSGSADPDNKKPESSTVSYNHKKKHPLPKGTKDNNHEDTSNSRGTTLPYSNGASGN